MKKTVFEVNVFGAMRLAQLVLPKMRENKYGKIVNISSVGGKIAFPLGGVVPCQQICSGSTKR
jgi:short-subunit dehydrogenase